MAAKKTARQLNDEASAFYEASSAVNTALAASQQKARAAAERAAERLRDKGSKLYARAAEAAADEAVIAKIAQGAGEAEAIAYVFGVVANLRSDTAARRVLEYVATKLGLHVASREVENNVADIQRNLIVAETRLNEREQAKANAAAAKTFPVHYQYFQTPQPYPLTSLGQQYMAGLNKGF